MLTLYNVCSVHQGMLSTSEGYHKYIRECSMHRGDTMSTLGDIMSTRGMFSTLGFSIYIKGFYELAPPHES